MNVSFEDEEQVILYTDGGKKKTPCAWAFRCPNKPFLGVAVGCSQCPAKNVMHNMDFSEAVEWWKSAKLVQH